MAELGCTRKMQTEEKESRMRYVKDEG